MLDQAFFQRDVYYIYIILSSYILTSYLFTVLNYKKYEKLVNKNEVPLSGIICRNVDNKILATAFMNRKEDIYFLNFNFLSNIPDRSKMITSENKLNKILEDYNIPDKIYTPVYIDYYEIYQPLYYNIDLCLISSYRSDIYNKVQLNNMFPGFFVVFYFMISLIFIHSVEMFL